MKIDLDELKAATEKAVELLQKKGHPHLQIIITQTGVKVVEDVISVPIQHKD